MRPLTPRHRLIAFTPHSQRKRLAAALLIGSTILGAAALTGCSSSEEREAKYLARAQESFEKSEFDKARVDLKNVLQINASNAKARLLFAKLEEKQQNWPQMYANLNAAIEADPTLLEARIKLAELLIAANQPDNARAQVDKILAQEPNNTEGLAAQAGLLFREKKPAEAEAICKRILELKPGHITATGLLAAIYSANDPEKALTTVDAGIAQAPDNTTLQLLRIQLLTKLQRFDAVTTAYDELIRQRPEAIIFSVQLANFYIAQQRLEEAEKVLRDAVARVPDNNEAKLTLVEFLAKHRKPEDARGTLEQFSQAAPDNYRLRTALARLYIALREFDKAEKTFQYVIDKDPKSAEAIDARNRIAELMLATDRRKQAEAMIGDILKIEAENGDALLSRARLALADNKGEAAIADLRTITKNSPDSVPALELLATAQERTGATNLALDTYQKLLQLNANHVGAMLGAARLLMASDKLDDAQKQLEQARKLAPGNLEVARLLVDLYSRREQWQPAFALSDELIANPQSSAIGHYLHGLVSGRKKDLPAALESMKKSLAAEPRALEPMQALINLYLLQKQPAAAVTYMEKFVKDQPDLLHAQEYLAALYGRTGKTDAAEKLLDAILAKEPARLSAYRELVAVYGVQNRRDRVAPLLQKGLQQNPDNIGLMMMLAEHYQLSGSDQDALTQYEKLAKLQPDSQAVRNNLALLLVEKFPNDANVQRAQQLTADFANSSNPLYLDTAGWVQYKLKNYPQAISLLESAVAKRPLPELRYHLGMAYLQNNMGAQAKEQLARATETPAKFPGREVAEAELAKL